MSEEAGIRAAGISGSRQAQLGHRRASAPSRRSRLAFSPAVACLAAARGPGRPGLQRCHQGGLTFFGRNLDPEEKTGLLYDKEDE